MKVFVGLGNPGVKYAANRHNIGYMALDRIAEDHGFSPWRSKYEALVAEGTLGDEKVVLLKPQTFMNLSGQSVGAAARFYKINSGGITVFHDELDLAPGKLRLKQGGGHAGHNGLRSIHAHIGPDYARVRLGIGHPGHKDRVSGYVLQDFAKADQGWLDDLLRGIAKGAGKLAQGDGAGFANAVALQTTPPREKAPRAKPQSDQTRSDKTPRDPIPHPAQDRAETQPAQFPEPAHPPAEARTALQKLIDRFR